MRIALATTTPSQAAADLLVVATTPGSLQGDTAWLNRGLRGAVRQLIARSQYKPSDGNALLVQAHGALRPRLILLVGVDQAAAPTTWHRLADAAIKQARDTRSRTIAVAFGGSPPDPRALMATTEGMLLSAYRFERFKSRRESPRDPTRVTLLLDRHSAAARAALVRGQLFASAACYARDLVTTPAAVMTPTRLAREARRLAGRERLLLRVHGRRALARLRMGAILGVAQGSAQPPCLIELIYHPRTRARKRIALVGKGITFDSGGLSLKHAESMRGQKRDMAGGAAVLAVMSVIRRLKPAVEVRGYIAAAENMPGGRAIKPGDVVRACSGKTIEVLNTDAEGRLVLADALAHAAAAKPDMLIDLATLTAAVGTALGYRYAGILGTEAKLIDGLIAAGQQVGERLWQLPLVADYRSDLDSRIADLKNIGEGQASTIMGALFLREFVGRIPWAHIDFSSTVVTDKPFPGHPAGATGFGVRTLLQFVTGL